MHKKTKVCPVPDEHGATATEYALMVGLIAMVIVAAVRLFGVAVGDLFSLQPGTFP